MKNVLIICGDYFSNTDANGICTRNLVEELQKRGKNVSLLIEADKNYTSSQQSGTEIIGIKSTFIKRLEKAGYERSRLYKLYRALRGVGVFCFYPNVSPIRSLKVEKSAEKIITNRNIDTIICIYRPYETIKSGISIKKKHRDITLISVHLDLITSPNTSCKMLKDYKISTGIKALKRELQYFEAVLIPEKTKTPIWSNKFKRFEFPLMVDCTVDNGLVGDYFNKDDINISYIGSIDGKNRDIGYIIKLLNTLNKDYNVKVVLHIWGNIDTDSKDIVNSSDYAVYHGVVDNKTSYQLLRSSDFCLNISNAITYDMIPSKIFQLFSVRKPIINIVENPDDMSLEYFERNNYCLNLHKFENDFGSDLKMLSDYLHDYRDYPIPDTSELYKKSKPSYMVDIIESSKK